MKNIPYGHQTIDAADISGVVKTLRGDWLTQGPQVQEFEKAVARACKVKYAVACANGTAALHLACLAAGLKKGMEAITSPITFAATANAVLYCGAKPVFADIERDTLNIDPAEIEKKITRRTKAILPVHFAGQPCDLRQIAALAKAAKLIVIEDAAHALGASYQGEPVGSCRHSDMAILSFHPVKHITTGEGGMVLTNRSDLYQKLRLYRSHGITREPSLMSRSEGPWYYEMVGLGFNYRISDIQCALGISQLRKLPGFISRRRAIAAEYDRAFSQMPGLRLPALKPGRRHAYHLYVVELRDPARRRPFYEFLLSQGISPNVHYIPVHTLPYYRKNGYASLRLKNAEAYYRGAVTLPIYPGMTSGDVKRVIKTVARALV